VGGKKGPEIREDIRPCLAPDSRPWTLDPGLSSLDSFHNGTHHSRPAEPSVYHAPPSKKLPVEKIATVHGKYQLVLNLGPNRRFELSRRR